MVIEIELPELPEFVGPTGEYLRVARLSLLEERERSAIDEIRHKYENEGHQKHNSSKHPHGFWHRHARDHKLLPEHGSAHRPEHGHKHGPKHGHKQTPGHKLGPMHGPRHGPPDEFENGHKHGVARLSLLEERERSAIDEIRHKYENEGHQKHNSSKHPHGFWHRHARDHKLLPEHGSAHRPEHGHKHGPKHGHKQTPGHKLGPMHGPRHGPPDEFENGHKHGPRRGPPPPYVKDPNAPKDKGYFVLIIIGLFGLVHMMPFMFFFTANEYWMYKFRNTTSNSTSASDRTYLQINFASLNRLTVTAPGVICNFIAAIGGHKIKAETRVFGVLFIHSTILISLAVFANIDTDDWQIIFFVVTMGLQVIMSCAMSLGGSGSMGLISKLPPRYMKAQLIGEGLSAVFSSLLRLISIFCTPSTVGAALMYFVTGSVLMVSTSIIFYFATKTKFFKYHTRSSQEERKESIRSVADFKGVIKIMWPMIILSIFPMLFPGPSVTTLVVSEYDGTENVWGKKYFITVCTYLAPALAGLIGRGIFSYIDYDCSIPVLYILVLSRELIFGALTLLSNAKPRHHFPVLLTHDWEYGLMMAGNSLSQGFIMTLNMMKSLRMVPKDRIELSMMVNMFFMSIFMAATSPLGVLVVKLI